MKRLQEIAVQVNRTVIFTTFILLLIIFVIILIKVHRVITTFILLMIFMIILVQVHRVMGCKDFSQYDCRCEAETGF